MVMIRFSETFEIDWLHPKEDVFRISEKLQEKRSQTVGFNETANQDIHHTFFMEHI